MRHEISNLLSQFRLYGEHEDNYLAGMFIFKWGDRGLILNLNGVTFYSYMEEKGDSVFKDLGVEALDGWVLEPHYRLMRMRLSRKYDLEVMEKKQYAGREMLWVSVRLKK